ncbi:MASE1 domain-containing protein [Rhodanobacter ginsengisoli]|uniref:MASE1 domain-containing protein n=1 Tax=Rhodanobacter ginsengisoli TaxID=418646 RepID=A0ABW0QP89_9GAMM
MQKGFRGEAWLRHIAVAVIYGLAVTLLRQLSISHWMILSGLYLSVLLLMRYRYWPALMLGEAASVAHFSYVCADQLGLAWALFNVIPTLLFIIPIAYWARERGRLFAHPRNVNMGTLLLCALIAACVMTLRSLAALTITKLPAGYPPIDYQQLAARWLLGDYLGILTITPLALFVYQEITHSTWANLRRRLAESRLLLESACILLPALGFLVWIGLNAAPGTQTRQIAQIAMFLPIVWLALRHGWHGAAVGGTAASLAILMLMPHRYDNDTIQAEIVIAFVMSTMLLMGARIAALDRHAQTERTDLRMTLALAQRNVQMGEMQLRMTAQALEQIRDAVQSVCLMMTSRLRLLHSAIDDRNYHRLALVAQDQLFGLADSLYPVTWQEKGVSAALREGQIPRALDRAGIRYWCDLRCELDGLSPNLHLAIYRLVCEAIADACARKSATEIGVRLRCGERNGRRWVVLRLIFRADPARLRSVPWDELLPRVMPASSGRGFHSIQDRAATFEGKARERALPDGRRISVLLLDPEKTSDAEIH